MSMTIPVIPAMPAGYIATAADMNNLAYGAQFLLNKPMARVHDTAGGLAIATTGTDIVYGAADFDTDGMWNIASNTRLTVQTPGFYKVEYWISLTVASGSTINANASCFVTTGSNNPAGSGVATECYAGYGAGGAASGGRVGTRASGVVPFFMYAGDWIKVRGIGAATGLSTSTGMVASWLSLELVSI